MPNHILYCQNPRCQKEFEAVRSDAKYCSESCKKAAQRAKKKAKQDQIEAQQKLEAPIRNEIKELTEMNQALAGFIEAKDKKPEPPPKPKPIPKPVKTQEEINIEAEITELQKVRNLSMVQFYNIMVNDRILDLKRHLIEGTSWVESILELRETPFKNPNAAEYIDRWWRDSFDVDQEMSISYHWNHERTQAIPQKIKSLKGKLDSIKKKRLGEGLAPKLQEKPKENPSEKYRVYATRSKESLQKLIEENQTKISEHEEKLIALSQLAPQVQPQPHLRTTPPRPQRKKRKGGGYTPEELRNMQFDLLDLSWEGDLGAFLGNLETKMLAIALIGDPTAGKSTFSYKLAKLFLNIGMKVHYFALEEGISGISIDKMNKAGIESHDPFLMVEVGSLTDIRKAAKDNDVVIVDSWSVLDAKPEEYNKLRQDFPETIFIVIFQKTTTGTIRGGTKIIFDTPMCMDVKRDGRNRYAVMEKSRYGTQGWVYSITHDEVVEDDI